MSVEQVCFGVVDDFRSLTFFVPFFNNYLVSVKPAM